MVILKRNFSARGIIVENAQVQPDEHVTIDLSVGNRFQVAGKSEWYELRREHRLRPGHCILVKTRERITLPDDIFGILCSKGSLSARGLIVSNTKVDPLFGDELNIPIFNSGRTTISISVGMAFCSICFHTLEQRVPRDVYRRAVTQQPPKRRKRDFFVDHWPGIVSGIVGAIAAGLLALLSWAVTHGFSFQKAIQPVPTPTPTAQPAQPKNIPSHGTFPGPAARLTPSPMP
jgi:deoxycytidine triphosphate deaminase